MSDTIYFIRKNQNEDTFKEISEAVKANDGYCPCELEKTEDTKCMCKNFKEQHKAGFCHCGRYYKSSNQKKTLYIHPRPWDTSLLIDMSLDAAKKNTIPINAMFIDVDSLCSLVEIVDTVVFYRMERDDWQEIVDEVQDFASLLGKEIIIK